MPIVPNSVPDELIGRIIDGRYEVREKIADGGMGAVYQAFDRRLERVVAIKLMHPSLTPAGDFAELTARFRREAKVAARLTHPGMVRVYDQGVDGDLPYLTMEYVPGQTLRAYISEHATLPLGKALAITEKLLDALGSAHRQGLVHRDIKPENILLDEEGEPRLTDFGLARALTEVTSTSSGMLMGTAAYLGPELISRGHADTRTDVYACGILLFEMLTGRQPFLADSALDVASRHVHEDVPPPSLYVPWLPLEVDELVARMTARNPANRPLDASASLEILRSARSLIDGPTLARQATPPSGTIRTTRAEAETTLINPAPAGNTIALPIGAGGYPEPMAEMLDLEFDPEAEQPKRERPRLGAWLGALVAGLMLVFGIGFWWYETQGPGAYTTVPPVIDHTEMQAKTILQSARLGVIVEREFHDSVHTGLVIRTDPLPQERIANGSNVRIFVSQGPRMETVPEVVGQMEDAAVSALRELGFKIGEVVRPHSDTAPKGEVLAISPPAGEVVRHDSVINLEISDGPAPVQVIDVYGMAESQAITALTDLGLKVEVEYTRTLEVERGQVLAQSLPANSTAYRTDSILLTVSEGRPLVKVPDFFGMTVEDAQKLGEASNLKIVFEFQWFPGPVVLKQSIVADKQVEVGTTVTLMR